MGAPAETIVMGVARPRRVWPDFGTNAPRLKWRIRFSLHSITDSIEDLETADLKMASALLDQIRFTRRSHTQPRLATSRSA
jgi:hypothetical protein